MKWFKNCKLCEQERKQFGYDCCHKCWLFDTLADTEETSLVYSRKNNEISAREFVYLRDKLLQEHIDYKKEKREENIESLRKRFKK